MNKQSLRQRYLERRKQLSQEEFQQANRQLHRRLIDFVDWNSVRLIHMFLPISHQREVDTFPIIEFLRDHHPHVIIAVPKIKPGSKELAHYQLLKSTLLEPNHWGVPEPATGKMVEISKIDVVLVPLLAFDRNGHRVGYGQGYYDRFLAQCLSNTRKIGLSLFDPEDSIPADPTDVALSAVVTPGGIFNFST